MKSRMRWMQPATLFFLLSWVVVWASWALSVYDVQVVHPLTGGEVHVRSVLSAEGARWMLRHALDNFREFAPLGVLTVWLAGGGLCVHSGLVAAAFHPHLLTRKKQRALLHVLVVSALYGLLLWGMASSTWGIFRSADGGLSHSAFLEGMPLLGALWIGLAGVTYGFSSGHYRTDGDMFQGMLHFAVSGAAYAVTAFFAAQLVACLRYSCLDTYLAIHLSLYAWGADVLQVLSHCFAYLLLIFPFLPHKN